MKQYDVAIVGSGAGGGMAAKVLAEAGAECVLLEAGQTWSAAKDGTMFGWNYDSPRRGAGTAAAAVRRVRRLHRRLGHRGRAVHGCEGRGVPVVPGAHARRAHQPLGPHLAALRSVGLQGAAAATASATTGPSATTTSSRTTTSSTSLVGLFGSIEGLPNDPDGIFLPPPAPRAYEHPHQEGLRQAEDHLHPVARFGAHPAAQRPAGLPLLRPVRARLRHATRTSRRRRCCCRRRSPPASSKIVTGAMAREVLTDSEGLATGRLLRRHQRPVQEQQVRAKIVVLAASACETARLLLNSKSPRHPNGLANSSGAVGRYLTDTTGASVGGPDPGARSAAAPQRRRHRRHAHLHAVVARQHEARLPARLPHRAGRRARHAGLRLHGRHPQASRAAATARS